MYAFLLAVLFTRPAFGGELRGAWVTAWDPGFFTPAQADATIQAAIDGHLNALFVQVRKTADAYYDSTLEPRADDIAPGFDPLGYLIDKAHAHGIQVHAWINVYRVWKHRELPTNPDHIVNSRREWLNKDFNGDVRASEGLYLDPGNPEARKHIVNVVGEIASRYDVDGIHLDYIRYPGKTWGYSDTALKRYYAYSGTVKKPKPGDPRWLNWRRDQVTALVRMIRERLREVRPGAKLTAATVPWGDCPSKFSASLPYGKVCQDWKKWLREGLLDANIPMNYRIETSAKEAMEFRKWLGAFKKWGGGQPVYVGIAAYSNRVADTLKQIEAVRGANHEGFVLFSFNQSEKRTALVDALRLGPCSARVPAPGGTSGLQAGI